MFPVELEASTGHELEESHIDPEYLICRFCGKTYEHGYILRMLAQDALTEPECRATLLDDYKPVPKCSCGIGEQWEVGHSYWCRLND